MTAIENPLLNAALEYAGQGLAVLPLHQTDVNGLCSCKKKAKCHSPGKHPRTRHGHDDASTDPVKIKEWWKKWPQANIGLRTGMESNLFVIDVDEKGGKSGSTSIKKAGLPMGNTPIVETPNNGYHYWYPHPEIEADFSCSLTGVDIKCNGNGYVVAPPSVVNGKAYTFTKREGHVPLPDQWVRFLTTRSHRDVQGPLEEVPSGMTNEEVLAGASNKTFDKLWRGACDDYGGDKSKAIHALIGFLANTTPSDNQVRQLFRMSRLANDPEKPHRDSDRYINHSLWKFRAEQAELAKVQFGPGITTPPPSHVDLPKVNVGDLRPDVKLPPLEYVVEKLLPVGVPTLFAGHGGSGKSMLGLQLASCIAAGQGFMGLELETMQVPVTVFSAEDSGIDLRHRFQRIFAHYRIDPETVAKLLDVRDVTEINAALYEERFEDGVRRGTTTPIYNVLQDACKQNKSRLVIIDNASDVFEANENDRSLVRGFMRSLGQLAREINGAVLLLAHVNKVTARSGFGTESYSGSTAWHNSARSRLTLTETDGQLTLSHDKSNRGQKCLDIPLSWTSEGLLTLGHIQIDLDDPRDEPDTEQLLSMFKERTERGDPVSTSRTGGNAFVVLSPLDGFPTGMDRRRFWRLVDRAEKNGRLRRVESRTRHGNRKEVFEVVE